MNRILRVVTGVVLVALTLWAAGAIPHAGPSQATKFGPFVDTGVVGETISARIYTITVVGVRGTRLIFVNSYSGKYTHTEGVFVLVRARIVAEQESTSMMWVIARDDAGRSFEPTARVSQTMMSSTFEPGVPIEGEWVFEVPRSSVASLNVMISDSLRGDAHVVSSIGSVSLGITDAQLADWLAVEDPIRHEPAQVVA